MADTAKITITESIRGGFNGNLVAEVTNGETGAVEVIVLTTTYKDDVGQVFEVPLGENDTLRVGIQNNGGINYSDERADLITVGEDNEYAFIRFEDGGDNDFDDVSVRVDLDDTGGKLLVSGEGELQSSVGPSVVPAGIPGIVEVTLTQQKGAFNGNIVAEITDGETGVKSLVTLATSYKDDVGQTFQLPVESGDTVRVGVQVSSWINWSDSGSALLRTVGDDNETAVLSLEDGGDSDRIDVFLDVNLNDSGVTLLLPNDGSLQSTPVAIADGVVDGADEAEIMTPGYADIEGDEIDGSDGIDDIINGNGGDDVIDSGDGVDVIDGGAGADIIDGNDDQDTIIVASAEEGDGDDVDGGAGGVDFDTLDLTGAGPFEVINERPDSNNNGTDGTIVFLNDDGTPTGETLDFEEIESIVGDRRNQNNGIVDGSGAGEDMGDGYVDADGDAITPFDDVIEGNDGDDVIDGLAGDDIINGGNGADQISGNTGTDVMNGQDGDDDIFFGSKDTALGGGGDDYFAYDYGDTDLSDFDVTIDGEGDATSGEPAGNENGNAGDILDLSAAGMDLQVDIDATGEGGTINGIDADVEADVTFSEIENLILGSGDDSFNIAGNAGPVTLDGGAGYDKVCYHGKAEDFTVEKIADYQYTVERPDGTVDFLSNIEGLHFSDDGKDYPIDTLLVIGDPKEILALPGQVEDYAVYDNQDGSYSIVDLNSGEEFALDNIDEVNLYNTGEIYPIDVVLSVAVPAPTEPVDTPATELSLPGQVEDYAVYDNQDGSYSIVDLNSGEEFALANVEEVNLYNTGETYPIDVVLSVAVPAPTETDLKISTGTDVDDMQLLGPTDGFNLNDDGTTTVELLNDSVDTLDVVEAVYYNADQATVSVEDVFTAELTDTADFGLIDG